MKTIVTRYSLILLIAAPAWAAFGPSTGGGGFVVSCPGTPVSPATTELLDIYEGRESLRFQMAKPTGHLREDYFASVDRTYTIQGDPNMAEQIRNEIDSNLTKFMQSTKFVEKAEEMPIASDIGQLPWIPSQCLVQQVAYFDDRSDTIYVLRPLWQQMDSVNQSALVSHELYFRGFRQAGELTSENARRTVAHIYALMGPPPLNEGLPHGAPSFSASGSDGAPKISVFRAVNFRAFGITRLQFTHVNGIALFSKTTADFPKMTWDFEFGRSTENPGLVACILRTPGVNQQVSAPLNTVMVKGYSIQLTLKTGEPVKMNILKDGFLVLSEGYVGGGSNCSESLH